MKRIFIDENKCKGCKNCALACAQARAETEGDAAESRNTILMNGEKRYRPLFCRHCDKPACVVSCMSGAMEKNEATGHVWYDREKCASCFMCVMSCSFGVLKPDRATGKYVVKCDFCKDLGSEPECVKRCPTKAITVGEVAL